MNTSCVAKSRREKKEGKERTEETEKGFVAIVKIKKKIGWYTIQNKK
jgi:hypothetical protein